MVEVRSSSGWTGTNKNKRGTMTDEPGCFGQALASSTQYASCVSAAPPPGHCPRGRRLGSLLLA